MSRDSVDTFRSVGVLEIRWESSDCFLDLLDSISVELVRFNGDSVQLSRLSRLDPFIDLVNLFIRDVGGIEVCRFVKI